MLLILLSIVEKKGIVDKFDFAMRMKEWMKKGYPELGDVGKYICEGLHPNCTSYMGVV